jgi:hypothetical protein
VGLNTDRAITTHKIDAQYLSQLSSDAAPALLASGSQVDASVRLDLKAVACAGPHSYAPSPAAFNWAEATAADARRRGCN